MDAHLWGYLLGRLVMAYVITLLLFLVFNRLRWQLTRRRLHSALGITTVAALFAVPLLVGASRTALGGG